MKFKLFAIFLISVSCTTQTTKFDNRAPYNSKGFAYIYNKKDYENKKIGGKLDNSKLQISHSNLRYNALIKIINPETKDYIVANNSKKLKYPDFYKILITKKVAEIINLQKDFPLVEIIEIKKNKSFVAKKAKIYSEEKKLPSKAPVASVQISNISKNKEINLKKSKDKIYILIGSFYSTNTAKFLKDRILKEQPNLSHKKLIIKKINNKETQVLSGPYNSVNLLKNDYIKLKSLGFEELDIFLNE